MGVSDSKDVSKQIIMSFHPCLKDALEPHLHKVSNAFSLNVTFKLSFGFGGVKRELSPCFAVPISILI